MYYIYNSTTNDIWRIMFLPLASLDGIDIYIYVVIMDEKKYLFVGALI